MIAEVVVGVWVATFAWLAGRWLRTRVRGDRRIGYLAEPERRPLPLPAPSLDLLVDLADPSVERPAPTSIPSPGRKESR